MQAETNPHKFHFKKILEFINRQESKFNLFKLYIKNHIETEKKGAQIITVFDKQIAQAANQITNKSLIKAVKNFSIHKLQVEHSGQIHQLMSAQMNFWLEDLTVKYGAIKQKLKNMERKKDSLTQPDIDKYKKQFTADLLEVTQAKESIIQVYCYTMIKHNSQQIERITDLMLNEKEKRESKK